MAAAEAISDNYVRASAARGVRPDLGVLHRLLMEQVIHGYDVLPSALHLTASTLALRAAEVGFELTNLYCLPHGGSHHRLGSIEFLRDRQIPISLDLFGASTTPGRVSGTQGLAQRNAEVPDMDLCVMNPPFTRSVGGNLLFGSVPAAERTRMQRDLSTLLRNQQVSASATAGLGSVFVAVGDRFLKEDGRIALVLPKALLSGVAWSRTRELFRSHYELEYLIVSHDPRRWNFSDNTDLSEVLVIARKVRSGSAPMNRVTSVNVWRNPSTAFEALDAAQTLMQGKAPDVGKGQGALTVGIGEAKAGEAVSIPWVDIRDGLWMLPCAFAQSELTRVAYHLVRGGRLRLPGLSQATAVPLAPLKALGTLGPDRRDIHDGFSLAQGETPYPAYWGHDANLCVALAQAPNQFLSPLPSRKAGRPLRRVQDLWPKAGRIALAERLRLNTQRLAAVHLERPALSNVWWPFTMTGGSIEAEKALVVWLNCTLGLIILLAHREETEGAWIDFKKPTLEDMLVLAVHGLQDEARRKLADAFDRLGDRTVLPFPLMAHDPVREGIDRAVGEVLGLPDQAALRELLGREPVVCLQPLA